MLPRRNSLIWPQAFPRWPHRTKEGFLLVGGRRDIAGQVRVLGAIPLVECLAADVETFALEALSLITFAP